MKLVPQHVRRVFGIGRFKTVGVQIDPDTIDINSALLTTMKHIVSEISVGFTFCPAKLDVI